MPATQPQLVLGSSSPFRKMLLQRLSDNFICISPDINEDAVAGEAPQTLVERLAYEKAKAIESLLTDDQQPALIIASDQLAICDGQVLGKPHTHENAVQQLQAQSGRCVEFLTSFCLYNTATQQHTMDIDQTKVFFRDLELSLINDYLHAEQPYNCCGSFKSEALGILLFDRIENNDPTALIGLPLIKVAHRLAAAGYDLFSD